MLQNDEILIHLSNFGITKDESEIYILLLSSSALTAREIASSRNMIVNSVYRSAENLLEAGLIVELSTRPKKFQAVAPLSGVNKLRAKRQSELEASADFLSNTLAANQDPNRLKMDLLTGQSSIFDKFVELAEKSKNEILVISVGETVPERIWAAIKNSIKQGIKPKFIFHRYDKDNLLLIKRWLALGVLVRHMPKEGYHLYIFDDSSAVLVASNPQESNERTGVVIHNKAIIEALRTYFFQQWDQSRSV